MRIFYSIFIFIVADSVFADVLPIQIDSFLPITYNQYNANMSFKLKSFDKPFTYTRTYNSQEKQIEYDFQQGLFLFHPVSSYIEDQQPRIGIYFKKEPEDFHSIELSIEDVNKRIWKSQPMLKGQNDTYNYPGSEGRPLHYTIQFPKFSTMEKLNEDNIINLLHIKKLVLKFNFNADKNIGDYYNDLRGLQVAPNFNPPSTYIKLPPGGFMDLSNHDFKPVLYQHQQIPPETPLVVAAKPNSVAQAEVFSSPVALEVFHHPTTTTEHQVSPIPVGHIVGSLLNSILSVPNLTIVSQVSQPQSTTHTAPPIQSIHSQIQDHTISDQSEDSTQENPVPEPFSILTMTAGIATFINKRCNK